MQWCIEHPDTAECWNEDSNSLILLAAPTERALLAIAEQLRSNEIAFTEFREPDLAYELTALCIEPSEQTWRSLSHLPLVLGGRPNGEDSKAKARERALRDLTASMRSCEQTKGQDTLAHGDSVRMHLLELLDHLAGGTDLAEQPSRWRLPTWLNENKTLLIARLLSRWHLERYTTLHDCGKYLVRVVDADGKARFPEHAQASEQEFRRVFEGYMDPSDLEQVARLIRLDMEIHTISADDLAEFALLPEAASLLLTGLAEVHANAAMFGGTDSSSFKAKWKHLDRRGRALVKIWSDDEQQ